MEQELRQYRLAVTFRGDRQTPDSHQADVDQVARTLSAFQVALYETAAHRLQLRSARALSVQQRSQYALAVTGVEYGSITFLLTPENLALGVTVYMAVLQTIQYFNDLTNSDAHSAEAASVLPQLVQIVDAANRAENTVELSLHEPSGEELTYRTAPVGNRRVLNKLQDTSQRAKRAVQESEVSRPPALVEAREPVQATPAEPFGGVTVLDISTTRHMLVVQLRATGELVDCLYKADLDREIAASVRVYDVITVYGRKLPRRSRQGHAPFTVSIEAIEDARGIMIMHQLPDF